MCKRIKTSEESVSYRDSVASTSLICGYINDDTAQLAVANRCLW